MASIYASGTLSAVVGNESTLQDVLTLPGTYQVEIDNSAMQAGDALALRIYTKTLSTSALTCKAYQLFIGVPTGNGDEGSFSIPVFADQEIRFTLQQTTGVARNFDWKVISL